MTRQSRSRASASAFTLIEILVVVAIIALLISILLPSLAAARNQARNAKCLANMRDMATGANTFAMAHKGRFQLVTGGEALPNKNAYDMAGPKVDPSRSLYLYESGELPAGAQGPALLSWPIVLLREAGNRSMRRNSDWGVAASSRAEAKGKAREYEQLLCPADTIRINSPMYPFRPDNKSKWYGGLSYAISEDIAGDDRESDPSGKKGFCFANGSSNGGKRLEGQLDKVVRPSEVLLIVDGGTDNVNAEDKGNLILSKNAKAPYLEFCDWAFNSRIPYNRHTAGGLNIAFSDGHGGSVKKMRGKYKDIEGVNDFAYMPRVRVSPYNVGQLPF